MNILLTGASGYIGKRLIPVLLDEGHEIYCLVRDRRRFQTTADKSDHIHVVEGDLTKPNTLNFPKQIDCAYYLVHSMKSGSSEFEDLEAKSARNFVNTINFTNCDQIIYLSGIVNDEELSPHLRSRLQVEEILKEAECHFTVFRAAIIIGSGSASFEIIRDLVEKLPLMVAPRWLNSELQPIAIRNVIHYLKSAIHNPSCYDQVFDIAGPDRLTYKQMLLKFAEVRGYKRWIWTLPVLTPRLSSYWLYFVTSVNYSLAVNLVDSLKNDVIARDNRLREVIPQDLLSYKEAVSLAFQRIEQNLVTSSWKDAPTSGVVQSSYFDFVEVPKYGCFKDEQQMEIEGRKKEEVLKNIWRIGGKTGWYYMNWAWNIRGFLDKLLGGVGLRRGRRSPEDLESGDALDFWRVVLANKEKGKLVLFAEMKLPGEAWLEFNVQRENDKTVVNQVATFRPRGLAGRLYWWAMYPFHVFIFKGMLRKIISS